MESDCLVLKINSFDEFYVIAGITVYVIYDINSKMFVICGKRDCGVEFNFNSYSVKAVEIFLSFIFSNRRYINYSISNHSELPFNQSEISYDYLNESLFENVYEIACKSEKSMYNKREVRNLLKMLKSVFNYY